MQRIRNPTILLVYGIDLTLQLKRANWLNPQLHNQSFCILQITAVDYCKHQEAVMLYKPGINLFSEPIYLLPIPPTLLLTRGVRQPSIQWTRPVLTLRCLHKGYTRVFNLNTYAVIQGKSLQVTCLLLSSSYLPLGFPLTTEAQVRSSVPSGSFPSNSVCNICNDYRSWWLQVTQKRIFRKTLFT